MARWLRNVSHRRAAIGVALALTLASAFFAGAAIFSVNQRANTDAKICESVQTIRNDLIQLVKDSEARNEVSIKKAFHGETEKVLLDNLHTQTKATLGKFSEPQCSATTPTPTHKEGD